MRAPLHPHPRDKFFFGDLAVAIGVHVRLHLRPKSEQVTTTSSEPFPYLEPLALLNKAAPVIVKLLEDPLERSSHGGVDSGR